MPPTSPLRLRGRGTGGGGDQDQEDPPASPWPAPGRGAEGRVGRPESAFRLPPSQLGIPRLLCVPSSALRASHISGALCASPTSCAPSSAGESGAGSGGVTREFAGGAAAGGSGAGIRRGDGSVLGRGGGPPGAGAPVRPGKGAPRRPRTNRPVRHAGRACGRPACRVGGIGRPPARAQGRRFRCGGAQREAVLVGTGSRGWPSCGAPGSQGLDRDDRPSAGESACAPIPRQSERAQADQAVHGRGGTRTLAAPRTNPRDGPRRHRPRLPRSRLPGSRPRSSEVGHAAKPAAPCTARWHPGGAGVRREAAHAPAPRFPSSGRARRLRRGMNCREVARRRRWRGATDQRIGRIRRPAARRDPRHRDGARTRWLAVPSAERRGLCDGRARGAHGGRPTRSACRPLAADPARLDVLGKRRSALQRRCAFRPSGGRESRSAAEDPRSAPAPCAGRARPSCGAPASAGISIAMRGYGPWRCACCRHRRPSAGLRIRKAHPRPFQPVGPRPRLRGPLAAASVLPSAGAEPATSRRRPAHDGHPSRDDLGSPRLSAALASLPPAPLQPHSHSLPSTSARRPRVVGSAAMKARASAARLALPGRIGQKSLHQFRARTRARSPTVAPPSIAAVTTSRIAAGSDSLAMSARSKPDARSALHAPHMVRGARA